MRVLIAPDSFKESLGAAKVAAAIASGVLDVVPDAVIDLCPMADGGEGTVAAMVAATGGRFLAADVFDPLGGPIRARFAMLGHPDGTSLPGEVGLLAARVVSEGEAPPVPADAQKTAVIEMAAASGLDLVPPEKRNPLRTTTFGTGQLILAALDAGADEIVIGIGGSATVDGGCGCAQALGVTFVNRDGRPAVCGLAGGGLTEIDGIDLVNLDPRVAKARIRVACGVPNPLTGPHGAAAVYGPQKGATAEIVDQLEAGLAHLAELIRRDLRIDIEHLSGAGAAGGLGGGLIAFAAATLHSGAELIGRAARLTRRLKAADLCITGEGKLDAQSASGKVAVSVALAAEKAAVPVICVPGQVTEGAPKDLFARICPLAAGGVSVRHAMAHTEQLLKQRTAEAVTSFLANA